MSERDCYVGESRAKRSGCLKRTWQLLRRHVEVCGAANRRFWRLLQARMQDRFGTKAR